MVVDYKDPVEIDISTLIESAEILEDFFDCGKSSKKLLAYVKENRDYIDYVLEKLVKIIQANYIGDEGPSNDNEDVFDAHIGCPAYPNCDIDSNGCSLKMGNDVEWYGHRD